MATITLTEKMAELPQFKKGDILITPYQSGNNPQRGYFWPNNILYLIANARGKGLQVYTTKEGGLEVWGDWPESDKLDEESPSTPAEDVQTSDNSP